MQSFTADLNRYSLALFLAFVLGPVNISSAQGAPQSLNVNDAGVFLDGYDVVSYFTENEARPGSARYAAKFKGAVLYFSSAANREAFKANPVKYMPKYGGYCAFAMANGNPGVKANPKTFKLYNGHLLMFFDNLYKGKRFNTSVPWNADEQAMYRRAEANWGKLKK